jgi:hypothetical protein
MSLARDGCRSLFASGRKSGFCDFRVKGGSAVVNSTGRLSRGSPFPREIVSADNTRLITLLRFCAYASSRSKCDEHHAREINPPFRTVPHGGRLPAGLFSCTSHSLNPGDAIKPTCQRGALIIVPLSTDCALES